MDSYQDSYFSRQCAVLLDLLVQRRPSAREVELAGAVASE